MVERLFLDRIDTESARASVAGELHLIVKSAADETQATLSLVKFACAWTYIALDPAVVQSVPVFGYDGERVAHGALERQVTGVEPCQHLVVQQTVGCNGAAPCGPATPSRLVSRPPASRTTMSSAARSHTDTCGSAAISTAPSATRQ